MVLTEWETVEKIKNGESFSRFGDGELKYIITGKQKFTKTFPDLQAVLIEALKPQEGFFAGVPPILDSFERTAKERRLFWERWLKRFGGKFEKHLKADVYGSSFMHRMDQVPSNNNPSYWEHIKGIWRGKKVIGITGEHFSLNEYGLFGKVKEIKVPSKNAWEKKEKVLKVAKKHPGAVFLLSCGVSAAGMAFLLWREGLHAVDIGKMGRGFLDGTFEGYKESLRNGYPW